MKRTHLFLLTAMLCAAGTACRQPATNPSDDATLLPGASAKTSQEKDWDAIVALENEAKAIAKTSGCASHSECRAAPVGNRACGGPRYYIAYCAASTDSAALFRKLDQVRAAENAYNQKYQVASTCEFRMPPIVGVTNGVCAEK